MRTRIFGLASALVVFGCGVILPSAHATVTSPSPGCVLLNDPSLDGLYKNSGVSLMTSPLAAGEVISITATGASAGMTEISATIFRFDGTISHTMVSQTSTLPTPGHIVFVVSDAYPYPPSSISWSLLPFDPHSTATWDIECIPFTAPPSDASVTAEPRPLFELDLDSGLGNSCAASATGIVGTWITLPSPDVCMSAEDRAESSFLGWSTAADFPLVIAQRQVNSGWGVYEVFSGEGRLSSVFIPAGSFTQISAPGKLYAIWSR